MAIALGTALAVGAIASAAGAGTKAVIQSKAAKNAADQQVQGTKEASSKMQEGLDRLGGLYSPYVNAGAGAMGTLGRLTTPGRGARFASPGPPNVMGGGAGYPSGGGGGYGGPPTSSYGPPPGYGGSLPRMQMPDGRPIQGPYPMAEGGDMMVDRPTMFLAGEAGPERASFSGAVGRGSGDTSSAIRNNLMQKYGNRAVAARGAFGGGRPMQRPMTPQQMQQMPQFGNNGPIGQMSLPPGPPGPPMGMGPQGQPMPPGPPGPQGPPQGGPFDQMAQMDAMRQRAARMQQIRKTQMAQQQMGPVQ